MWLTMVVCCLFIGSLGLAPGSLSSVARESKHVGRAGRSPANARYFSRPHHLKVEQARQKVEQASQSVACVHPFLWRRRI